MSNVRTVYKIKYKARVKFVLFMTWESYQPSNFSYIYCWYWFKFLVIATAETKEEVNAAPKAAPAKKPPAKAAVKPLPQMMDEDVIPSLKAILEAQKDISDIELVFQDNKVILRCFFRIIAFFPLMLFHPLKLGPSWGVTNKAE